MTRSADAEEDQLNGSEIAIIGMSCRFPGARNCEEFWNNLIQGVESVSFLKDEEIDLYGSEPEVLNDPNYIRAASILDDADLFDASHFGYTPREAEVMDPQQRLLLECSSQALANAGYDPDRYKGSIGVYVGARTNTYLFNIASNPELLSSLGAFEIGLGNDLAFLSTRVSYKLNLRGPSYSVHTACSTSLVAVHLACQSLLIDECQMALAGGVAVNVPQKTGYLYRPNGIMSPDGHTRTFDAKGQGTLFGSGVGVVVLKRLEDALADRDSIYAIIKGSATNNEGSFKASFTAPSVYGQTEVIAEALATAGVDPKTISYLEAHGTGTAIGDPIEVRALTNAFRSSTEKKQFCAIGSVKTNIGHLDAAAGVASLIKTALALKNKKLPPSLHYEEPNPKIDFENSPFYVNTELTEWNVTDYPRRAGVSAFGVGGTNAHVILEEAPVVEESAEREGWELLVISARTEKGLEEASANLAEYLGKEEEGRRLGDVAYTLQVGRKGFGYRRAVVCKEKKEGVGLLEGERPEKVETYYQEGEKRPVVFMFPGGGAQYVGMGRGLYEGGGEYRESVDRSCEILKEEKGYDLREMMYAEGREEEKARREMRRTRKGLPALFVTEYAMARQWMKWGIRPEAVMGHSMGEYVAATIAGVFSLKDALRLVAKRGELMEEMEEGAMVSVWKSEEELKEEMGEELTIAAINGPRQCVVAGRKEEVEKYERKMEEGGEEYRRIQIEVAAHSRVVEPILERFEEYVRGLEKREPEIRMISNVSGKWMRGEEAVESRYWRRHLREGVRFWEGLEEIRREVGGVLLEVGPGQSLSRLARMSGRKEEVIVSSMRHAMEEREEDEEVEKRALGRLWGNGVEIDWEKVNEGRGRRRIEAPGYVFERKRYWIEREEGKGGEKRRKGGKRKEIGEWFYVPVWKQSVRREGRGEGRGEREERRWIVLEDEKGKGEEVSRRLRERGEEVVRVKWGEERREKGEREWEINGGKREDYEELMKEVEKGGKRKLKIVHMWSMRGVKGEEEKKEGEERFEEEQERGSYSVLRLGQALMGRGGEGEEVEVTVVMEGVWGVESGDKGRAEKATVVGGCKVMGQEGEGIRWRVVDMKEGEEEVEELMKELEEEVEEEVVALRGRKRWVQEYEEKRVEGEGELREGGVYVITGGYGGIGMMLGEYITKGVKGKVVLVGRREPGEMGEEGEEKRRRIEEMKRGGGEVMEMRGDVTKEDEMRAVVERTCERWGRIDGWIHAAGVTSGSSLFKPLTETEPSDFQTQFRPKAYALYVLEKVLEGKALDFCLLFSSNASVLGGLGFVTYSSANSFMDAFATECSRKSRVPWISASWDPWPEETKKYAGVQTSLDQYTMTTDESMEAFRRVACLAPRGHVVVATGDLKARLDLWSRRRSAGEMLAAENGPLHPRPGLQSVYVAPNDAVEEQMAQVWQRMLGIERVGINDNFFELGGHSLLATRLVAQLRADFSVELPLRRFFETPTISGLARVITELRNGHADEEEILRMVAQLKEDEVDLELKRRESVAK